MTTMVEARTCLLCLASESMTKAIEHVDYVTSPELAADAMMGMMMPSDREIAVVVSLNTKHKIVSCDLLSVGTVDHTFMAPREVYLTALKNKAAAIVIGHCHPSGDPEPSKDDETLTRRLVRAGEMIGIELLDHIVVGDGRWTSLARRGIV